MLTEPERAFLFTLARDHPLPSGTIVDAGPWVGGSTLALALGLRERDDRRAARIHSYDLFRVTNPEVARLYREVFPEGGFEVGDTFVDRFETLLDGEMQFVTVYEGDVRERRWGGAAIDVLFIDLAKDWDISDRVHAEFLPSLAPGPGVLIQQDYIFEWQPWLHVLMELLWGHFEFGGTVPDACSAVFRLKRAITREDHSAFVGERALADGDA